MESNQKYGIYCITNHINGKRFINYKPITSFPGNLHSQLTFMKMNEN